jgi:hypothetical protein
MSSFTSYKSRYKHGVWLLSLTLVSLFSAPIYAQNKGDIEFVDAVFAVSYNNATSGGDAKLTIKNHQNNYDVSFNLKHSLIDINQNANFSAKDCHITPQSYQSSTSPALRSTTKESLNFNWANKTAIRHHSKDGDTTFNLKQHVYDPMSLFFKARCDLMAGKKQLAYPLIYKGRETTHRYHVIGTEKVKTDMGVFEALVVQRQRSNKNRQTTFYVAPALDYLIVKIHHRESSLAQISMTLKSMNYKAK